ncbi:hypothetical protein AURDEDRAFT_82215 [Auricularia subglabra TFB-10046 SS5]|nr:hypothetical protein AURDEDRAFT_82215 [Auricularia subglabra TFB-10046 SS5]
MKPLLNAKTYAYINRSHEENIAVLAVDSQGQPSLRGKQRKLGAQHPEPSAQDPDVQELLKRLELDPLRIFRLDANAMHYVHPPRRADLNSLVEIRSCRTNPASVSSSEVVLIISVYSTAAWHPHSHFRISQHALLGSQTLTDFFNIIYCPFMRLTADLVIDDEPEPAGLPLGTTDCVMCIEGVAYGDGANTPDYSDRLLRHIEKFDDAAPPRLLPLTKGAPMHSTRFLDLPAVRINEPYYLLHQGDCEHYFVLDQIRLLNADDPRDGYPQTLQSTPQLQMSSICRICSKLPASVSLVGDKRLAESPCLMCASCFKILGWPKDKSDDMFAVNLLAQRLVE